MPHVANEVLANIFNKAGTVATAIEETCQNEDLTPGHAIQIAQAAAIMLLLDYRNEETVTFEMAMEAFNKSSLWMANTLTEAMAQHNCEEENCEHHNNHKTDEHGVDSEQAEGGGDREG